MGHQTFIPRDYDVFAGLDVDKRSISVTFTDHQGLLKSLRIPNNVEHLVNHVRKHFPNQRVAFAYEAGPTGYGLYDGLVAQEFRCLIASPSMIPKAPGQRVKTNRLDSVGLSENLRGGQLKGIHVPSPLYRELRHLTQLRDTFVNEMVGMKQCIKYMMSVSGIGWIVASQLLARIGDWRELRNIRQLGGFLGLVPTEHSTGERTDRGSITRTGDERLRSKMIQASWSAIRKDAELREFFRLICHRHPRREGPRVAIVAVARKLSVRISVVLMQQRPYVVREKVHSVR